MLLFYCCFFSSFITRFSFKPPVAYYLSNLVLIYFFMSFSSLCIIEFKSILKCLSLFPSFWGNCGGPFLILSKISILPPFWCCLSAVDLSMFMTLLYYISDPFLVKSWFSLLPWKSAYFYLGDCFFSYYFGALINWLQMNSIT